jgi:glycerol-3-phosphate acyltransferase PlsY
MNEETVPEFSLLIALTLVIGGYLLGSILPAEWFLRRKTGHSARELDENPGGAGTYRKAGFAAAAFVTIFDIGKGLLPVALADHFGLSGAWLVAAACAPAIGHNWPIYKGFRGGGKGLASVLGAAVWLGWPSILPGLGVGAALVLWKRWAPWIGVAGLPLGLLGMAAASVEAPRIWAVIALLLVMLLRIVPWFFEQRQARQKTGKFIPPNKSW